MNCWVYTPPDSAAKNSLAKTLRLPAPVAEALMRRGYGDPIRAETFLRPRLSDLTEPWALPDMDRAVVRILQAMDKREPIVVFGDYDADGVTATALLVRVLRQMGAKVTPFLPHRMDDGYGLSVEATQRCVEQLAPKLIITVDCGTSSVEAVQAAAQSNVDVVVTDHHLPGAAPAPACAVVNPKRAGETAFQHLAGVGVAFKLAQALALRGRGLNAKDVLGLLDLVAVGTIADVVPLVGENRILAWHGLRKLEDTSVMGLKELQKVARVQGAVNSYTIGFVIGPRLNAVGRLDSAQAALDLLLSEDVQQCSELAEKLHRANGERQRIEQELTEQIIAEWNERFEREKPFAIVADGPGWHPGVIGIVAARLSRHYYRPAAVLSVDSQTGFARGSCRSIEEFNIVAGLAECADLLERYGGHAMAAGLSIRADRIEEFRRRLDAITRRQMNGVPPCRNLRIDAMVDLERLDVAFVDAVAQLEPFGMGNPKPVWAAFGVGKTGEPRVLKDKHLELSLSMGHKKIRAVGFGWGQRKVPDGALDVVFEVVRDDYWGVPSVELRLIDLRPCEAQDSV